MKLTKAKLKKLIPNFEICFNRLKCTVFTDKETWDYIFLLAECEKPKEVASVAMIMYENRKVDDKKLVTKHFIEKLIPFCVSLEKEPKAENIRAHINKLLIALKELNRKTTV